MPQAERRGVSYISRRHLLGSHIREKIDAEVNKDFDLETEDLGVLDVLTEIVGYANGAAAGKTFKLEVENTFAKAALLRFKEIARVDPTFEGVIGIESFSSPIYAGLGIHQVTFTPTAAGQPISQPRRILAVETSLDASSVIPPYEGQIAIGRRMYKDHIQYVYLKSQTHNSLMTARTIGKFLFSSDQELMKSDNISPSRDRGIFSGFNLD